MHLSLPRIVIVLINHCIESVYQSLHHLSLLFRLSAQGVISFAYPNCYFSMNKQFHRPESLALDPTECCGFHIGSPSGRLAPDKSLRMLGRVRPVASHRASGQPCNSVEAAIPGERMAVRSAANASGSSARLNGTVGFNTLGRTCFSNSANQCLICGVAVPRRVVWRQERKVSWRRPSCVCMTMSGLEVLRRSSRLI
jgi:hypothetical protein